MDIDQPQNRKQLRTQLRRQRRALSRQQQHQASQALCRRLKHQLFFLRSKRIAFYLPNDGEIDPTPLLKLAYKLGKRCYLPVLAPLKQSSLWFIPITASSKLRRNRYGISEPSHRTPKRINAKQLDLVLMPLVGFDSSGGRLGMGGGYYDRSFAFRLQSKSHKPKLLGLAHSCQRTAHLSMASWDIAMDGIATDKELMLL